MANYCPQCRGLMRSEGGILQCIRCAAGRRARVVQAKGKAIRLGAGQDSLFGAAAAPGVEPTLEPQAARWHAHDGGTPHPVLGLFPYDEIRDGQKRLARDVRSAVAGGKHLVAQAPTGIGKTAAALGPALQEALAAKKVVLFLTSRQSQHRIAIDTLRRIQETRGVRVSVVDLVAKRDMCLRPEAREMHPGRFPDFCAMETRTKSCRYLGVPDKPVLAAVRDGMFHVEELMHASRQAGLCPHIVALEAAKTAHVVVADYNHLFSDIREQSLERLGLALGDIVAIVDEAHNLPDRIRASHEHRITRFLLDGVEAEATGERARGIEADVEAIRGALALLSVQLPPATQRLDDRTSTPVPMEALHAAFEQLRNKGFLSTRRTLGDVVDDLRVLGRKLRKTSDDRIRCDELAEALEDWNRFGEGALRFLQSDGGAQELHIRLLDPALASRKVFEQLHSAILMSGTLRPPEMYRDLLGLDAARTALREYPSPYDPQHRLVLVAQGYSTRFQQRTSDLWDRVAGDIARTAAGTKGNLAVFATSYDVVAELAPRLAALDKPVFAEASGMTKGERDAMIGRLLDAKAATGAILLGVLGGSFSEGVDYKDNLLSVVAVVGLPLAPRDLEVESRIQYLEKRFPGKGNAYGYTHPAMGKVLQALGRGVRGPDDKCLYLLLDQRFMEPAYRSLLPDGVSVVASRDIPADGEAFLRVHGL